MTRRILLVTALFACIQTAVPADSLIATIPIKLQHNRFLLAGTVNEKGPYSFLLDSACTIPTIHPTLVDELKLEASGRVRINGIAGVERAPTFRDVTLQFGEAAYKPRRVASIQSEREHSRRRDGVVGSGFFETFVVEFRPSEKVLHVYRPADYEYSGKGKVVSLRMRQEIPVVEAAVVMEDGSILAGDFEVDTGCDSGVCFGEAFVKKNNLVEKFGGKQSEKFGIGGSVETVDARIPMFRIGDKTFKNSQADLFLDGSPVDDALAGHIGMGVLGKAAIIIDYARKRIIFE